MMESDGDQVSLAFRILIVFRRDTKRSLSLKPADVYIIGSNSAFGSRVVASEEVDRAFGMPVGKLKKRAGIHSLAYVGEKENEGTLGAQAASQLLDLSGEEAKSIDWIVAASETYHAYPSLSAILHGLLRLREECGALDVGSGCLALLQALAVAQSILAVGRGQKVLVVTSDVHSRTLGPGRAKGEFGGLFGDGASAFLLTNGPAKPRRWAYRLGEFFFGCAVKYAEAIRVSDPGGGQLDVQFDGEALSRAAVSRMEKILGEAERRSGISRTEVGAFATHQPNPRLVALLAKHFRVPACTFPSIAATRGNLGSSTCGAALHAALVEASAQPAAERKPVFLASLGPGLLFGGGWLVPAIR
jgi:3-oxoacyl-[acyl-carrier-protein] synthase III